MDMGIFYRSNTYSATVSFTTVKSCFLRIPEKWLHDNELCVFKLSYGENKEKQAYFSCCKDVTNQSDLDTKVFINQKFAVKLGIKEDDLVILERVTSSIPMAVGIIAEPLTSDDWEIMRLNDKSIESNLMNQIRVVWKDQIFPVWVQNNYFFFKVVECEPDHCPVVLHENSEVRIEPKDRHTSNSSLQKDNGFIKEEKRSNYLQFHCLRSNAKSEQSVESNDSEDSAEGNLLNTEIHLTQSIAAYAPMFFTSWFSPPKEESQSFGDSLDSFGEFFDFNFDSVLRVLPYTNPANSIPSVVQATTVFISASTYIMCCGDNEIPPCFVAVLEKYPLPGKKQKRGVNDNVTKNNQSDNDSLTKTGNNNNNELVSNREQKPFDSICVTVMVVKSFEEDEFNLPACLFTYKNAIVVPKELKRALSLEVACLVNLKSVKLKPLSSYRVIFHPVTLLNPNITEKMIQEHFIQWAFGKKRKHCTFVISDGTLIKLKFHSRKCEFFIHLQEKEINYKDSNQEGSLSSLENVSFKSDSSYGLINYKIAKRIPIKIGPVMCMTIYDDRPYLLKDTGLYCDIKSPKLSGLGGIKKLSIKAVEDIEFWLKLRPLSYISNHSSTYCGCLLICGPKGVGKSSFSNAICKKFGNYPYHVLVRTVNCLSLKGKRVEVIAKKWDNIVSEAIYSQPSVIFFEDLDYIASAPLSHEQENGPDGVYFSSISQAFINTMNRITASESKIVVIATCQSLHSLHPSLVNTKGRHVFQSILEISPPNIEQRSEILFALIRNKPHISQYTEKYINLLEIATKTEGYVAQDLSTLVDRATHSAWIQLAPSEEKYLITLKNEDFINAIKGLVPSSLRGISLQIQDQHTWENVGGLNNVKKVIQQIIMWPTKYKQIFKNYSLKPQTNILLYGAPGTGKTLLAGVVANECGLNFISIKGPELLSKYIGASEQAVRDLFKRATTARPCILFFDEFDSIAPRRGHDSTGVTDRVVNQLLTQLDGVESLEGVHVLAATSRPELIDPALLRPGRLDKCLHCPLPDKNERVEILNCLSLKLPLSDDINFDSIASLTENFSGADLQALLYSAHIEALHEIQNSSTKHYTPSSEDPDYQIASDKLLYIPSLEEGLKTPSYEDGKKIIHDVAIVRDKYFGSNAKELKRHSTLVVIINQRHLLKVASEMKPSVSLDERIRYELVFKNFQNVLSGEPPASPANRKRVTLA